MLSCLVRQRKRNRHALYDTKPLRSAALLRSQVCKVRRQRRNAAQLHRLVVAPKQQHQVQALRNVGARYELLYQRVQRRGELITGRGLPRRAARRLQVRNDDVSSLAPRNACDLDVQPEQSDELRSKSSAVVQGCEQVGALHFCAFCSIQHRANAGSNNHSAMHCPGQNLEFLRNVNAPKRALSP